MKIACFWAEERSLDRISFRHELLIDGFRRLGHEACLVTARELAGRYDGPASLVARLDELASPGFWRTSGFDLAVGVTWLRKTAFLEAIAAAGIPRVAIADSDGQLGYAAHPRAAWAHLGPKSRGLRETSRAARYFARRWLSSLVRRDPEEREILASARASSAIGFTSPQAIGAFRRFVARHGEESLADRAFAAPFPVPEAFCGAPLPEKENRIVAIGRWSDPQKNAPRLAAALERFVARVPDCRIEIFGSDGEAAFGALAKREPRVEPRGVQEPPVVLAALARARSLVLASRWETGPHVAGEALALGTTLVSTPLPTVAGLIDGGRFGTLAGGSAGGRSPSALAAALEAEQRRWEEGARDPAAIAAHWRAELRPEAYCARLLAGVAR